MPYELKIAIAASLGGFTVGVLLILLLTTQEFRLAHTELDAQIADNKQQQEANLAKAWELQRRFLKSIESIKEHR